MDKQYSKEKNSLLQPSIIGSCTRQQCPRIIYKTNRWKTLRVNFLIAYVYRAKWLHNVSSCPFVDPRYPSIGYATFVNFDVLVKGRSYVCMTLCRWSVKICAFVFEAFAKYAFVTDLNCNHRCDSNRHFLAWWFFIQGCSGLSCVHIVAIIWQQFLLNLFHF